MSRPRSNVAADVIAAHVCAIIDHECFGLPLDVRKRVSHLVREHVGYWHSSEDGKRNHRIPGCNHRPTKPEHAVFGIKDGVGFCPEEPT